MKKIFFVFAMVAVATLTSCSPGLKQTGNKNLNFTGDTPIVIMLGGDVVNLEITIDGTTYTGSEILPTGWTIKVKSSNDRVMVVPHYGIAQALFAYSGLGGSKGKFTVELLNAGVVDSTLEIPFK
jgi:hypothetical protein